MTNLEVFWIVLAVFSCVLVVLGGWHLVSEIVSARRNAREMSELSARLAQLRRVR